MRPLVPALLAVCLVLAAGADAAPAAPLYTNAELISIDVRTRVIVVRTNDGRSRAMRLEEAVATGGLRPGDEVILAVHEAPGSPRVSRILRSEAGLPVNRTPRAPGSATTTATTTATSVAGSGAAPAADPAAAARSAAALDSFNRRVSALAQQAGSVDALWWTFAATCDGGAASTSLDRQWLTIWEAGTVGLDVTSGYCRELYNQILARGQVVSAGMAAAEEAARTAALLPGDIRDVRRQHSMDWNGWGRPAPDPLQP